MALSAARRAELAKLELPSDKEMAARAVAFQQRSGLTLHEFSQAIGYAATSLSVFLCGHYGDALNEDQDRSSNTRAIKAALKEYMDRWECAQPPEQTHSAHVTADYQRILDASLEALQQGTAVVIDGPPGTQKTFSLRSAERRINNTVGAGRAIYIYARIEHTPLSFLREICNSAGIWGRGNIDQLIRKLRFFLAQERILLMVDEGQHLPHQTLEVLRQLMDLPPYFGVMIAGSHDLSQRLWRWSMEQWSSRIRVRLELNGPSKEEAFEIIRAELGPQTDEACREFIARCQAKAERGYQRDDGSVVKRKFKYTSARDLFFSIEGIKRQLATTTTPATPATTPQKESAA